MALAPLQVAIPERLALAIPPRLVEEGKAAGRQIVVTAAATATAAGARAAVAVAETIAALDAGVKILLRLR